MSVIYWAGSEESYEQVLKADARIEALQAREGMTASRLDEMLAALPPIWRHEGSTAVIEINGPVVDGDAGWRRLFDVLGYDNIAQAAIEAASHVDTKSMLYHINSPGGAVSGITDMSAILARLSELKPSAVHTSNLMCSAGYWMASSIAGQISCGPVALVGSIGVLQIHTDLSKMYDGIGVKFTVLRSGKYKAETNSYEPLSEDARQRAEAQLADVHALFRAQVAKGRPGLTGEQLADVTEGQTFLGKRAVSAGLADRVTNFELALKLLDKQKPDGQNSQKSTKGKTMKVTLSAEQVAAIQAGDTTVEIAESVATPAAAPAAAAAAPAAAAAAPAAAAAAPADAGVVALLQSQLAAAQEANVASQVELRNLKASTQTLSETHAGLLAIARQEIGRMNVALGGTAAASESLGAAEAIAEHAKVSATFVEKFPVGRQSVQVGDDQGAKPAAALPMGFEHAVKSVPSR